MNKNLSNNERIQLLFEQKNLYQDFINSYQDRFKILDRFGKTVKELNNIDINKEGIQDGMLDIYSKIKLEVENIESEIIKLQQ